MGSDAIYLFYDVTDWLKLLFQNIPKKPKSHQSLDPFRSKRLSVSSGSERELPIEVAFDVSWIGGYLVYLYVYKQHR